MKKKKILCSQGTDARRDNLGQLSVKRSMQNSKHQNPRMYFEKMSVMRSSGMLPVGFFSVCIQEERESSA